MSVPFANWAGTERDWGCPSTWSFPNKDIHSVPGTLAQERGRLLVLCVEVALSITHSWLASGAPPCRFWSSPFFLWPETMSSIRSSRTAVYEKNQSQRGQQRRALFSFRKLLLGPPTELPFYLKSTFQFWMYNAVLLNQGMLLVLYYLALYKLKTRRRWNSLDLSLSL
jgi:hypothetical protein